MVVDVEAVRSRAREIAGVVRLADEGDARRAVAAVRVSEHLLEVEVVLRLGVRLSDVSAELRRELGPLAGGRRVVVTVEDLV